MGVAAAREHEDDDGDNDEDKADDIHLVDSIGRGRSSVSSPQYWQRNVTLGIPDALTFENFIVPHLQAQLPTERFIGVRISFLLGFLPMRAGLRLHC